MERGIHLSVEALLSVCVLLSILFLLGNLDTGESEFSGFYIMQKQHDLLKVWMREGKFDFYSMEKDVRFLFPESCYELVLDNYSTGCDVSKCSRVIVSEEYFHFIGAGNYVRLGVCY